MLGGQVQPRDVAARADLFGEERQERTRTAARVQDVGARPDPGLAQETAIGRAAGLEMGVDDRRMSEPISSCGGGLLITA
jgi:hypothetical protein